MAGMVNLLIACCMDEVDKARAAMTDRELELDAEAEAEAAKSLEEDTKRLRDADILNGLCVCCDDARVEMRMMARNKKKVTDNVDLTDDTQLALRI